MAEGAEAFVVIANWPAKRQAHWTTLLRARAIENQAWVVGVNRVGRDPKIQYAGGSCVIDPQGRMLLDAGNREGVFSALCDPEASVRQNAARALGSLGGERAELLLRMRILEGDQAKENYSEYFDALIGISPEKSVEFIAPYLNCEDSVISEQAALALGESRRPDAFLFLKDAAAAKVNVNERKPFLLAIALLRLDEGFGYLLDVLDDSSGALETIILDILKLFPGHPKVAERIMKYSLDS